jgi:hypothetical protein
MGESEVGMTGNKTESKMHSNAKRVRAAVHAAFMELRAKGYFTAENFLCCQSCGRRAAEEQNADRFVFYHGQDHDDLLETGEVRIAWNGDGEEIRHACIRAGLRVDWNGSEATRHRLSMELLQ